MNSDNEIAELKGRLASLEAAEHRSAMDSSTAKSRRRHLPIGVVVIVGLLLLLIVYTAVTTPKTVGEVAEMYKQNCIHDKGGGNWQASSGVSLEKFCEASGDYQALMDDKKRHPEAY